MDELASVIAELGPVEQKVLLRIAKRLLMGQDMYGHFREGQNDREWEREAQEEAMDMSVYLSVLLEELRAKKAET